MIGLRYRVGRLFGQAREFIRGSSCEVWDWKEQVIIVIVGIRLIIVSIVNIVITVIVGLIVIIILISFDSNKHNSAAKDFHP